MEAQDPEYISIDFELTHCPECARDLDKNRDCSYCEERTREEVLIEMQKYNIY